MGGIVAIYHAECLDGLTALWALTRAMRPAFAHSDMISYAAKHGEPFPFDQIDLAGRGVFLLDFCYPEAEMRRMTSEAAQVTVYDHHATAQPILEALHGIPNFRVAYDLDRSGAGITWDEAIGGIRPLLVNYVEDRDLWRFAFPRSREVHAWLCTFERTIQAWDVAHSLLESDLGRVIGEGRVARAVEQRYAEEMSQRADVMVLDMVDAVGQFYVPCVNVPYWSISEVLDLVAGRFIHLANSFVVGYWQERDGGFRYSLRPIGTTDVSMVARRYGGGGHRSAAGFRHKRLLVSGRIALQNEGEAYHAQN